MKKQVLLSLAILTATFSVQTASAQRSDDGSQAIFVNQATRKNLDRNASTLRDHLRHRRTALQQFLALPASELRPITLQVQAVAKNRGGFRELRVREFHYIGDCPYAHGGQDAGVNTPSAAQATFASDLANSYLNQAALLGIPIDSIAIEIHGRPDKVKTNRISYPRNYLYTVYIDTPASDSELEHLAELAEANSPVVNFIKLAQDVTGEIDYKTAPAERKIEGLTLPNLRDYLAGKRQAIEASKALYEQRKNDLKVNNAAASAREPEGQLVRVFSNGVRQLTVDKKYLILQDNPAYLGGSNLGLTSLENLVGVLATCFTHIAEGQAATLNIPLDSLALTVQAKWDPRAGKPGFENVPSYPTGIHYIFHVKTPASLDRIKELQDAVEKTCPMYNLFKDGPQTFEKRIVRVKSNNHSDVKEL